VELALAKGKKIHDKRAAIKKREEKRELQRELKGRF
jgi:SsrA-binding protein